MTNTTELRKRFEEKFPSHDGEHPSGWICPDPFCHQHQLRETFLDFLLSEIEAAEKATAQQCYLECLAVGCGETEYSEAINSKFNLKN